MHHLTFLSNINVQLDITALILPFEPNMAYPHGTLYQNEKKSKILTREDRINVTKRHNTGKSARSIAKALGCNKTQIVIYLTFLFMQPSIQRPPVL